VQRLQELLDGFLDYAKVRRLHLEPSDLNHQIGRRAGVLCAGGEGGGH